jgi:hypothetical protein
MASRKMVFLCGKGVLLDTGRKKANRAEVQAQGVTPGQFYQYRVRAQADRNLVSDWSNEAVVYGSQQV